MKKYILTIVILAIGFASCKKEEPLKEIEADYILFGNFAGMCVGGNCINIFKLTDTELFEDTNDIYPDAQSAYQGNFKKLNNSIFDKVKNIRNSIPYQLFNEANGDIGMPDYCDGGGLYFEYHKNGVSQFWKIDPFKSNIPQYLHPFVDDIIDCISIIYN
ncbi:MAG: hypothetical protein K9J13_13250 [Saprospiraceae bacterium]|nr:hypothetical protein [Saprospiraceae bacterium]